ncbi:MAG: ErfK/YbiS/YcfS/YnhG family protein [Chthoniobacteraceae bacterium]|nr:ErfK/YbiS/YcfS/YnhG family protein [Chthoniobacteraceae bacterium]
MKIALGCPFSLLASAAIFATAGNAVASTAIVVSVPDQKMVLVRDGERLAQYKISTSRFGLGDKPSSYATPLGKLEVAERIGKGLPMGAVLKGRQATGEVLPVNAQGRDPIVTRILYLRGLEACNQNAHNRSIYIHGTPVERTLGKPDSWGCIRMRSQDVVALFDSVAVGATVEILNEPMRRMLPGKLAATRPQAAPASAMAEVANARKVIAAEPKAPIAGERSVAQVRVEKPTPAKIASPARKSLSSTSSVAGLSSLGGVENLHGPGHRDGQGDAAGQSGHGGMGLSLSLW